MAVYGAFRWPVSWRALLLMLAALVLIWVVWFDSHSLWRRWELERQRARLIQANRELQAEIARLQREIALLRHDPRTIERIAREEYGMRRPGETIYRLMPRPR